MKYEKWSFGYWCFKQYIIFADWLIHKKTIVTGREKIPKNKPILFAPNHQNALSDPLAVLLHTRYQPVWLGRADIFKSKYVVLILRFFKIIPVYRLRDGKENLGKNDQTFADSIKVLKNNKALALFPEAAHSGKRQMLPHKKAVPRIVFMAEEQTDFSLDIQIIPTGINYSHYWKFDRTLIVNFGNPIRVREYLERYRENPGAAVIALKNRIYESILPLIINYRSKRFYEIFERIRMLYGNHFLKKQNLPLSPLNRFHSDQLLARRLDELEINNPEATERITLKVKNFLLKLQQLKLRSWLLDDLKNPAGELLVRFLILLIGAPLFLYGLIFNAVPFFLTDVLIRKKVKDKTFWSTFFLVAGIVIFPVVYLAELLAISALLPGFWLKPAFLISLPFAGKLAFKWYITWRKAIGLLRLIRLKWFSNPEFRMLINEKQEIIQQLDDYLLL